MSFVCVELNFSDVKKLTAGHDSLFFTLKNNTSMSITCGDLERAQRWLLGIWGDLGPERYVRRKLRHKFFSNIYSPFIAELAQEQYLVKKNFCFVFFSCICFLIYFHMTDIRPKQQLHHKKTVQKSTSK